MAEVLKDCLEEFVVENVGVDCDTQEDIDAGTSEYAYYALEAHVVTTPMPVTATDKSYAGAVTITEAITMVAGKHFAKIDLQVDLNELKAGYVGNTGNQKINSNFDAYIAGLTSQLVGMQKKLLNKRLILIVPDNNGNFWLLGTKAKPARITTFDIATGKTSEDNNGATVNVLTKTNLYKYTGAIPLTAVVIP